MNNSEYDKIIDVKLLLKEFLSNLGDGYIRLFTDPIADEISKWISCKSEKERMKEYLQFACDNQLYYNGIHNLLSDYALYMFISNIGYAEYKFHKSALSSTFKGLYTKLAHNSFMSGFMSKRHKLYKCATLSIVVNIRNLIKLLFEKHIISQEDEKTLCDYFIKPTHVQYSLLMIPNLNYKDLCTLYRVINYNKQKDIISYYRHKYEGYPLIEGSITSDYCSLFFRDYTENGIDFFNEDFY